MRRNPGWKGVRNMGVLSTSPELTMHERRVAALVAEGYQTKQIAFKLGVSPKTIDSHRQSVMRKIKAQSLVGIVRYAIRNGLVTL